MTVVHKQAILIISYLYISKALFLYFYPLLGYLRFLDIEMYKIFIFGLTICTSLPDDAESVNCYSSISFEKSLFFSITVY